MKNCLKYWMVMAAAVVLTAVSVHAQDGGALVDALVKKGVLTDQEGEEIRADLTKEYATTSAGKLNVSNHIKQLTLYGDGRWRYEYNNTGAQQSGTSTSYTYRARYRIRLGADYKFTDNFSAGFELESSTQNDGAMQTVGAGFGKFSINVGLLYLTYKPWDFVTLTAGKMKNPFYTTDLVWDPDVNPEGAAEIFSWKVADNLTVGFAAGQFQYTENTESTVNSAPDASRDSWIIGAQMPVTYKVNKDVQLTFAPGAYVWTWGGNTGTSATFSTGTPSFSSVHAADDLTLITAPGDVQFKAWNQKFKFYWDFAYNVDAKERIRDVYQLTQANDLTDGIAWLAGIKVGDNKKKGDWSISADYRQVGVGSVDPNLSDSEWGNGFLNQQGVKVAAVYNFTDFLTGGLNSYTTWNYKENLVPSGTTGSGYSSILGANYTQRYQAEITWKF
jgi:hypothetical protein